jgi:hypothetical protein
MNIQRMLTGIPGTACLLMLLSACGPPVSDDAQIVDPILFSSDGVHALNLGKPDIGRHFALIGCFTPGKALRVVTVHQTYEPFVLATEDITINEQEFPLEAKVSVDGESYVVTGSETAVDLMDDDPDPDLNFSEITVYADTTNNDLLEALLDAEWIEVSALGETWAAEFSEEMVSAFAQSCEQTRQNPPFDLAVHPEKVERTSLTNSQSLSSRSEDALSAAASKRVEGRWRGFYYEGQGRMPFHLALEQNDETFAGSCYEPNSWVAGGPEEIKARIEGTVERNQVRFTKIYEPIARIDETIVYQGEFTKEGAEIEGQWHMEGRSGTFHMWQ